MCHVVSECARVRTCVYTCVYMCVSREAGFNGDQRELRTFIGDEHRSRNDDDTTGLEFQRPAQCESEFELLIIEQNGELEEAHLFQRINFNRHLAFGK